VDVSHDLEGIDGRDAPPATTETAAAAPPIRRVLIVVDSFFPSLGGTERLAEGVGVTLEADGVTVDVATRPLAERTRRGEPVADRGARGRGSAAAAGRQHVAGEEPLAVAPHGRFAPGRLAIIGGPSPLCPQIADEVRAVAAEDPRIRLLGPAGPAEVAAAMRDASLLLLPSLA
jgi:hypothetical protein